MIWSIENDGDFELSDQLEGNQMHDCGKPTFRSPSDRPLFQIDALTFQFPDGHPALNGIDLTIYAGDRIALVGPNGAGKTTLVKHLNGLYRPVNGMVRYRGQTIEGDHLLKIRLEVGMLFQDPDNQLFSNTLHEDVAFGPLSQGLNEQEVEFRVQRAIQQVGLQKLLYKAPHHLSYGQKKRAALATLLSMNPPVLILDEPTAYLDPKQETIFFELLAKFTGTLICISHDLPFLYMLCLRAVVLAGGKIQHDLPMRDFVSHRHSLRDHGLDFTFRLQCCREHEEQIAKSPLPEIVSGLPGTADASTAGSCEIDGPTGLARLDNYSYQYPDGSWGCKNVHLEIDVGERVALIGENGAGKSTLIASIMGILRGNGRYWFNGMPVDAQLRKNLWRHVGIVFQDPADQLFCPSCWEEVAFGPKRLQLSNEEIDQRVHEALAEVRLEGFDKRVPHHLSSGERKRLAIASVLSMRPEVLILDEPTANLDPRSEELMLDILSRLHVTLLLVTHDAFFITALCERTVVMHLGRVIRDYPTKEFELDVHLMAVNGLDYHVKDGCCQEIARLQEASG